MEKEKAERENQVTDDTKVSELPRPWAIFIKSERGQLSALISIGDTFQLECTTLGLSEEIDPNKTIGDIRNMLKEYTL